MARRNRTPKTAGRAPLALALMLAAVVPCAAQRVSILKPLKSSCGQIVAAAEGSQRNQILSIAESNANLGWVIGVLSAYHIYHGPEQQLEMPDLPSIKLALTEYCRRHPTHDLSDAMGELIEQLGGRWPPGHARPAPGPL
jgi:hypothetical protein